jgi:NADH:ubiquinone oxidoreductase subunit 6 (subunit J)
MWWAELLLLVLAMAALVVIAVTMVQHNHKEQPVWKYSVNLNTLIALLFALLIACMVLVVEEGKNK